MPLFNDSPEYVWFMRAAASAKLGDKDPHREGLLKYYNIPKDDAAYWAGKFLLGLASESELLTHGKDPTSVAFALGWKAQCEGRIVDASDWYRVCLEAPPPDNFPRALAIEILGSWIGAPSETLSRLSPSKFEHF